MADLEGVSIVITRPCENCEAGVVTDEDKPRECGICEGTGRATEEIPLAELADWIVARVPVALIPRADLAAIVSSVQASITAAASKSQGLADPDDAGSWLRVVQEGAEALRSITDLLDRRREF